jgi:hypothetical protein
MRRGTFAASRESAAVFVAHAALTTATCPNAASTRAVAAPGQPPVELDEARMSDAPPPPPPMQTAAPPPAPPLNPSGPVAGTLLVSAGNAVTATLNGHKQRKPDHNPPVTHATVTIKGKLATIHLRLRRRERDPHGCRQGRRDPPRDRPRQANPAEIGPLLQHRRARQHRAAAATPDTGVSDRRLRHTTPGAIAMRDRSSARFRHPSIDIARDRLANLSPRSQLSRQLIWRVGCQGGRHGFPAFAGWG